MKEGKVAISIEEGVGLLDVEDEFQSPNPRQIEGIYRFSVPPHGFVASFANMRAILGVLDMYDMDHAQMMARAPETLEIDISRLVKEQYLKTEIQKPSMGCEYYGGPDSLTGTGRIICALHGYVGGPKVGQYPGVTAENKFGARCEETGCDPDEFFIDFQPSELDHPDTPLYGWLEKHEFLLGLFFLLL